MSDTFDPNCDKFIERLALERRKCILEQELKSYLSDAQASRERVVLRSQIRIIDDKLDNL